MGEKKAEKVRAENEASITPEETDQYEAVGYAEEIVIESSYGLGESIVSGDVTPDRLDRVYQAAMKHRSYPVTGHE